MKALLQLPRFPAGTRAGTMEPQYFDRGYLPENIQAVRLATNPPMTLTAQQIADNCNAAKLTDNPLTAEMVERIVAFKEGRFSQVRLHSCSTVAWYKDRIGDAVKVEDVDSYGYWTRDTGPMRCIQWIAFGDASPL